MSDTAFEELLTSTNCGVLVTLRSSGRPQLSDVYHHYEPLSRVIRISSMDSRMKARNLRRDPRASYYVTGQEGFFGWVVAEATAAVSEAAAKIDDAVVDELVELYPKLGEQESDWDAYRQRMVDQRRVILRLQVERFYGLAAQR
jgi:PPOX class probable F420-dependent enzyme